MDILIASSQKHASYASIMQVLKKKQILNKTDKNPSFISQIRHYYFIFKHFVLKRESA